MKFLYNNHLTHSVTSLRNKIGSSLCDLQQIFNISNGCWNSIAIVAPLAFMLMHKAGIKFRKVYLFVAYSWVDYWFKTIFSAMRILMNSG